MQFLEAKLTQCTEIRSFSFGRPNSLDARRYGPAALPAGRTHTVYGDTVLMYSLQASGNSPGTIPRQRASTAKPAPKLLESQATRRPIPVIVRPPKTSGCGVGMKKLGGGVVMRPFNSIGVKPNASVWITGGGEVAGTNALESLGAYGDSE